MASIIPAVRIMFDNIRAFHPADMDDVIRIYANSKLDELQFEQTAFKLLPLTDDKARYSALLESNILVFETDQSITGFAAYYVQGLVFEIRGLFVGPEHRGKGIGQALLQYMLEMEVISTKFNLASDAKRKQSMVFRLYIATSNTPARRLYEKHGFQSLETFETEYNGLPVKADRMERYLPV